ncbi:retrovirus-related pol polyprotein from transposon TNT 1-94 [Tanacetum coccineum]
MTEFPQMDSGLTVPVFNPGDDPITCLNKAMAFLTVVASSRFPSTNNQLRIFSNPRNQATIQDGGVTVQQVQGRHGQSYAGNSYKGNATSSGGNNIGGQARVVKCYNYQGEGHMARKCTQPKRPRNAAWFKEKAMLVEAQEAGQILDEEQLAFLPDSVLMANLSNYGSDVILEGFEQTSVADFTDNEITSDSNIIPPVVDDEETLILEEVSRSKMLAKQNDPILKEKKVNTTPINYVELNRLSEDFGIRFVPQQELSAEQAFCLKRLNYHLGQFDTVVKKRITPDVITEGEWGYFPSENERLHKEVKHLKKIYKDQFDLIKKTRALFKEYDDSLIGQLNSKSMENADLKCQIQDKVESSKTPDSNTLVLSSTRLKCSTSTCRLHPTDPICDANVKHTMLNANSELICVKCNQCMFDANHDACFLDFVNDVNVRSNSKSAKKCQHHNIWKPTGKVFTEVGSCPDYSLVSGLRMFKTYDREPLSAHELYGVDLLYGSRDTNLYTISLDDMLKTSLICLLSKASKTKSWLWNRRLSHLSFDTLNKLAKDGLARGIPKLKFQKDHLCSACSLGKSKKSSHQPKAEDTNQEKLYLLHIDLCGSMHVESINGKIRLNAIVRNVRTDNGTEFFNQTLREFYENVGISHQTYVALTPQQNGVVERRNRTLVEAARTMLIFSKAPSFLWDKAINTACYTQNRSLIHLRYNKNTYELMHNKKPDLSFLYVFGSLCYPTNDSEDLGKLNAKADIATASEQFGSGLGLQLMTPATTSSGLVPNPIPQQPSIIPRAVDTTKSPVSTSIDLDAPSTSIPSTQEQEHSPIISQSFEESPKTPHFHDDPLHESLHEDSTSQGSSSNVRPTHTPFEHLGRWTKDHPIANVIGDPSRSISTRKQLETDAMWCHFDAFLTSVEPKNFKQAMTEPS